MADVVRNGAIFRVKNPAAMRSPMPRLPARGRIAAATPETPAMAVARSQRSALESVVSRPSRAATAAVAPPRKSSQTQAKTKKTVAAGVVNKKKVRRGVVEEEEEEGEDGGLLASFNRIVSESESRRASMESSAGTKKRAAKAMPPAAKEEVVVEEEEAVEEEETVEEEESSDGSVETPVQQPPQQQQRKGRKRQRAEPEEEPSEPSTEEDDATEEEEEASQEELVTPQRKQRLGDSDEEGSSEDEDAGVRVQKRLMYDDTPPAKFKPKLLKPMEVVVAAVKQPQASAKLPAKPVAKAKADSALEKKTKVAAKPTPEKPVKSKKAVASGNLELLSLTTTSTPKRATRIRSGVLIMSEWYVDWPPSFSGDELQLVLHGQVLGQPSTFTVRRRVSDTQFVSSDNQNVRLDGCLDIEKAQRADVPAVIMELLVEGIPTHWRQLLEAYAPPPDPWMPLSVKSKEKAKQRRAKAAAEAERKKSVPIPGVTKQAAKSTKSTKAAMLEPVTPNVERRSRSGRVITPVMEWWRNERKLTTASFDSKIVVGSPAYLPSKRLTSASAAAQAARQKIQEIYEAQRKSAEWSDVQLTALHDAKVHVPTTHPHFWSEVAKLVPGKNADECRARSFDDLPVAPVRKHATSGGATGSRGPTAAKAAASSQAPTKIHRAGSNLFKKQVRQFVHEQEKKNVDDLFSLATPSKSAFAGAAGLDDLKSPGAPMADHLAGDADDSDDDGVLTGAGRELLEKVSLSKRDEVDSYVRTLKRGNEALGLKAVRTNKSSTAPGYSTPKAKKRPRREGVHMVSEVGNHVIEAIVTPGGTTRVRVEKGSDAEDDLDEYDEEEEALSDGFF